MTGRLSVEIDSTYSLERIKEAIAHAAAEGRNGKILLLPNGDTLSLNISAGRYITFGIRNKTTLCPSKTHRG